MPWRKSLLCLIGSVVVMAGAYPGAAAATPAWLAPETFSDSTQSFVEPSIAVDERGDAAMVWNGSGIHAAYRPAGGSWQTAVQISGGIEPGSVGPYENEVVMNDRGDAIAVWSSPDPNKINEFVVQAAVRPAGGAWQPPETISAPGESTPNVAIDQDGNAIAAWTLWNGSHQILQVDSRPAGGTWQAPADLTEEGTDAYGSGVSFGPQGEAIVTWATWDGSDTIAEAASKPAGGEWQAPVQLSETGRSATNARVAFDAAGDAVAIWELEFDCPECSFNGEVVQSAYKPAGGTWQAPEDLSESGKKAEGAHIAVDAAGNAVAVWERVGEGPCCVIQAASKPAGGTWRAPVQLSVEGGNAGDPTLAVDPAGDAVALWTVLDESEEVHLLAGLKSAGGGWQAPVDISEPGRSSLEQQIAYDAQGDALVAWRADGPAYLVVQATAYDAAGPLLEGLSVPAAGTPGQPLSFSVAPLDAWSALGATSWDFGDGTGATGTSAAHVYAAPGAYTVTVTGEDALGNTSSATRTVEISPETVPEPPPQEPPPKETPPTPSQSFKVLHLRVRPDGALVLRLKSPTGGAFGACARVVSGPTSPAGGSHPGGTPAPKGRRGRRHCPDVPSSSAVSFFGAGAAKVSGAGFLTLTIRPHGAALQALHDEGRWRALVKVTFTPTGGRASSVTKGLAWP